MIRQFLAFVCLTVISAPLISQAALAEPAKPIVAISLDIPPYVMEKATTGLEVDIMRHALADDALTFTQMPYADLHTAVQKGRADVSVAVRQHGDESVFYSDPIITFENIAASKKSDNLKIDDIADLSGHQVLTWQGADRALGGAFERRFAPGSPERVNYVEVPNQENQVHLFWERDGSVAVIDHSIFVYFTKALGHSMDKVDLHYLFPSVTHFRVAFKDSELRDTFNRRVAEMCRTGEYKAVLERYDVVLEETVCDR